MSLPDRARGWVEELLGAEVVDVDPLTGGVSSRMLGLRTATGSTAVLRQLVDEPYRRFATGLLTRERAVHGLLVPSVVNAPTTLGLDADGSRTGDPSLLMTRLRGAIDLVSHDDDWLGALARTLLAVHAVVPDEGSWPRDYQSWATPAKRQAPPWAGDVELYRRAFEVLGSTPPSYERTFLHRDFQPANVLWRAGAVAGIVDWVETSTGPADLDVAHCCSNLAGLHGAEVALRFRSLYVERGGVLARDADAATYWQVLDLVGFLPDGSGRESGAVRSVVEAAWAANGRRDLSVQRVRARREDLLRAVLG